MSFTLYVCSISTAKYNGNFVHDMVHKHGYHLDGFFSATVGSNLTMGSVVSIAEVLFDKISWSNVVNLSDTRVDYLFHINIGTMHSNIIVDVCIYLNFSSRRSVFDRGKEISLILWNCCFTILYSMFEHRLKLWHENFMLMVLDSSGDIGNSSILLVQRS